MPSAARKTAVVVILPDESILNTLEPATCKSKRLPAKPEVALIPSPVPEVDQLLVVVSVGSINS